jgi:outer membrane protein assembly factor BamA
VKFLLDRDTRDNYLFPTEGSYIGIENQFAGLGGSVKLYRFDVDTSFFFTISHKYEHILALSAKFGSSFPFGHHTKNGVRVKNETPYSERFFLGGDSMMRGFEFRDISPRIVGIDQKTGKKVYGDPLGGNSYAYFGAEYTAKIFERLYIAGFAELGCVNAGKFKFFKDYNANIGFGFRIFAMGMPVRLDFGYPVMRSKNTPRRGSQFNFTVGTSF